MTLFILHLLACLCAIWMVTFCVTKGSEAIVPWFIVWIYSMWSLVKAIPEF